MIRLRALLLLALALAAKPAHAEHEGKTVAIGQGDAQRRFLVGRRLGSGYWSHAYEATEHGTERKVTVKIWRDDRRAEGHVDSYDAEHRVLQLAHGKDHAVLKSLGTGHTEEEGPRRAMVTAFREQRLTDLIAHGPLPQAKAVRIARKLLKAVAAMEATGLRHNDLKPDNILIDGDRSKSTRLGDVGNALPIGEPARWGRPGEYPVTDSGAAVNDDVHAVACVLVDMMAGKIPQLSRSERTLDHVQGPLREVLERALHAEPGQRYASAAALREALRPFATDP